MGGRSNTGGRNENRNSGTSNVERENNSSNSSTMNGRQLAESLPTDSDKRTWLRSLEDGEVWASIQDNRTVEFQKMEGTKKYIVTERGNRYNADGSYTPYNVGPIEVGEKTMLNYLRNTRSLRKRG